MIKKIFVKILKKLDLKILKISKNKNSVELLVKLIQKKNISLVFDIGANTGQFAKKLRDENYKKKIISFEPLKKEHEQMKKDSKDDQNWDIYDRCAVGEINGEIKLNISNYSPSSSILDFHKNHKKAREDTYMSDTDTVKIFKLDTIVDKLKLDTENVLIKIDTQGYENKIIIGADRILSNCKILFCEVSLKELYQGQELWNETIKLLENKGFSICSIENGVFDAHNDELLQADIIFIKNE